MLDYDSSEYFYPYSSLAHQAATKINVAYKHHFARRVNFAISIQSFYRGWSVRCEIRELREYQTPYAIVVQCFIRQLVAKQVDGSCFQYHFQILICRSNLFPSEE